MIRERNIEMLVELGFTRQDEHNFTKNIVVGSNTFNVNVILLNESNQDVVDILLNGNKCGVHQVFQTGSNIEKLINRALKQLKNELNRMAKAIEKEVAF